MEIIKKTWEEVNNDRTFEGAAVLAFYLTLATFPAMIAFISLLPFLSIEGLQDKMTEVITSNLPGDVGIMILDTTRETLSTQDLGILSTSFLGTLWVTSSGMSAVMSQLNVAYNIRKERGYIQQRLLAILLSILYIFLLIVATAILVVSDSLLIYANEAFGLTLISPQVASTLKYLIGSAILLLSFASIYYFGPNGDQKFKYITPGSLVGTILLIVGAIAFDYYVSNFGSYDRAYGSLGGIIVYMLWLYIAGFVLLLGAEINQVVKKEKVENA